MTPQEPAAFGKNIYPFFLLILLGYAMFLAFEIAAPFLNTLIFAAFLAILFSPIYRRLAGALGGRSNLAAGLTTLLVIIVFAIPMTFLVLGLLDQGRETLTSLNRWVRTTDIVEFLKLGWLDPYLAWVKVELPFVKVDELDLQARFLSLSQGFTQWLVQSGRGIVANLTELLLHFLLMTFMVFYFLRDGRRMVERIKYLVPLRPAQEDCIIESLHRVARSVLMGTLLVAVLQGVAGGIGFAIVGIPGIFWGAMVGLASLVPVFGTGIIWVPAAVYLLVTGAWQSALFVAIWFGVFVVSIDTLLRPIMLREASRVSVFFVFLAILGGVYSFGVLGILYGPLILSFALVMLQLYGEEYRDVLTGGEEIMLCPAELAVSEPATPRADAADAVDAADVNPANSAVEPEYGARDDSATSAEPEPAAATDDTERSE